MASGVVSASIGTGKVLGVGSWVTGSSVVS